MLDDEVAKEAATDAVRGGPWRVVRAAGWAYSLGLWRGFGHPEVAIFGWAPRRWGLVNVVAELVSAGVRLAPGSRVDDVLLGGAVEVRRIDDSWLDLLFAQRESPEFLQVVWPDQDGRYPWEGGAFQPRLWLPVADHPPGPWTKMVRPADWRRR
jgi:Domain of unknown function (DUF4262)